MKIVHTFLLSLLFILAVTKSPAQGIVSCKADGSTDVTVCLQSTLNSVSQNVTRQAFLSGGTYLVSQPIIIPNKTQISGVGRGDPGINTVIKASPSFPKGQAVIQMGPAPGPNFGIQITNMTIDGSGVAGSCLSNQYSEELSWGRSLLLVNCSIGLSVTGGAAQNSGPFEDLEIYPQLVAGNASTLCIQISNVPAFRGLKGVTCNGAGGANGAQPAVGLALDGNALYADIHVEQVNSAISLGSSIDSADGMTIENTAIGPNVTNGVLINSGFNNQNLTLIGIQCQGCANTINDQVTGRSISDPSVGWYMIGNGGGGGKTFWTSKWGMGGSIFGDYQVAGRMAVGPGNPNVQRATLNVWDATPGTGVTSVIEFAGQGQGTTDIHEWRDMWNNVITSIDDSGALHTSTLQVNGVTGAACAWNTRGTFNYVQSASGTPDHVQVCAKAANGGYNWVQLF